MAAAQSPPLRPFMVQENGDLVQCFQLNLLLLVRGGGGGGGAGGRNGGYVEAPEEAGAAPQREPRAGLLLTFIMMLG